MMAGDAHWRRLGYLAMTGEHPRQVGFVSALLLAVAMLGVAAGAKFGPDPVRSALQYGGMGLAALAAMLWLGFCSGAARQNTPANAHLVPGLNGALRTAAVTGWLVTMAAMLPFAFGHADGAMLFPLLGVALIGLGLHFGGRMDGFVVCIGVLLVYVVGSRFALLMQALSHPLGFVAAMLACLAYAAWALPRAFPRAGERHWKMRAVQRETNAVFDLAKWNKNRLGDGGAGQFMYRWLLTRDCRHGASVGDMLLHGLSPGNHRYRLLVTLVIWVALLLMVKPVLLLLELPVTNLAGELSSWAGVVLAGLTGGWLRFAVSIRKTAGEQAVLRLAPAMPASSAFNRVLGRRIAAICVSEWAVMSALMFAALFWWDANAQHNRAAILIAAMALAGTGLSFQNFARRAQSERVKHLFLLIWMVFLVVAGGVVGAGLRWAGIVALLLATSLVFIALRWRRMQRGPVAFPANRMD
jgi:hypothetical protein